MIKFYNNLLAIVLMLLGLFLITISFRLSSVIESSDKCLQAQSRDMLLNSNRGILILGVIMMTSSFAYFLCKIKCSGKVKGSPPDNIYLIFNLFLGIVITVLFSIIRVNLDSCSPSYLTEADSILVNVGIGIGASLLLMMFLIVMAKFFSKKEEEKQKEAEEQQQLQIQQQQLQIQQQQEEEEEDSPFRIHSVEYIDPLGFHDYDDEIDPEL